VNSSQKGVGKKRGISEGKGSVMALPSKPFDLLISPASGGLDSAIIQNILDSMSDSLLVVGDEGEILYANKATKDVLGYTFEEFKENGIGKLFFLNEENYDFNQVFIDVVWKKSINNYSEVDYHHPDGSIRRLAATTSYLLAEGENESIFIGFIALIKDITEIFNLRRKEKELAKELTEEKERIAKEKISSLHKLAMGVAHEIRNPMVTIGGFAARILRDSRSTEDTRRYAQSILEDARKLEKVVDKIQQYSNLPAVELTDGDPAKVLAEAVSEGGRHGKERSIELRFQDLVPKPYQAKFDRTLLKTAMMNLLENAIDFSPDGTAIDVLFYLNREGAVMEVRDSGVGIEDKDREFIFDPFFSTRIHRSGMGLALVDRIVREHMGKIEVDSTPGKGTTVRIVLPHPPE
jgi:PAS domain S-box-containing protein